jgi:hypothetical protein
MGNEGPAVKIAVQNQTFRAKIQICEQCDSEVQPVNVSADFTLISKGETGQRNITLP